LVLSSLWSPQSTAILTVQGWRVEQRRLREQQKLEAKLEYRRQQIEELYGPLWGMIQQNQAIYGVAKKILPNDARKVKWDEFKDDDSKVWNFFFEFYLLPIQSKMAELINAKSYLLELENGETQKSLDNFINHQSISNCLYFLWKEQGKSSLEKIEPHPYPEDFHKQVKLTLDYLKNDYNKLRLK